MQTASEYQLTRTDRWGITQALAIANAKTTEEMREALGPACPSGIGPDDYSAMTAASLGAASEHIRHLVEIIGKLTGEETAGA